MKIPRLTMKNPFTYLKKFFSRKREKLPKDIEMMNFSKQPYAEDIDLSDDIDVSDIYSENEIPNTKNPFIKNIANSLKYNNAQKQMGNKLPYDLSQFGEKPYKNRDFFDQKNKEERAEWLRQTIANSKASRGGKRKFKRTRRRKYFKKI